VGVSLLTVTVTPASSSAPTGCSARDGTTRVHTLEVGHTSSGMAASARYATSAGSIDRPDPVADAGRMQVPDGRPHAVRALTLSPRGARPAARPPGPRRTHPRTRRRSMPASAPGQAQRQPGRRRVVERGVQRGPGRLLAELAGDVVDPRQVHATGGGPGPALGPAPRFSSPCVRPTRSCMLGRDGELGVDHRLARQVGRRSRRRSARMSSAVSRGR
jgi:hypothetical protein